MEKNTEIYANLSHRHNTGALSWLIPIQFGLLNGKINVMWGPFEIRTPMADDAETLFESTLANILSKAPMAKDRFR